MKLLNTAQQISGAYGIDIPVYHLGTTSIQPLQGEKKFGISDQGLMLVRPDGYIAWRHANPTAQPQKTLERVFNHLLYQKIRGN